VAYPPYLVFIKHTFDWVGSSGEADVQEFGVWAAIEGGSSAPDWPTDLQAIADQARDKWIADWPASWFSPAVAGKMVSVYEMDNTLHAVSSAVSLFSSGHTWVGSGSNGLPPQDALVVTTYADDPASYVPHRARRRGRYYLPVLDGSMLSSSGQLAPTHQTGILGAAVSYFDDLHATSLSHGASLSTCVLSRTATDTNDIGWVGVGVIVDTQRRRRNKLIENYATASL